VRTSINIDEHGVCCYDLVSVDSKTLVFFFLLYLVYVFLLFVKNNLLIFGTRLTFN
jgi:hypothetical protein